jgi:hypothetical protein
MSKFEFIVSEHGDSKIIAYSPNSLTRKFDVIAGNDFHENELVPFDTSTTIRQLKETDINSIPRRLLAKLASQSSRYYGYSMSAICADGLIVDANGIPDYILRTANDDGELLVENLGIVHVAAIMNRCDIVEHTLRLLTDKICLYENQLFVKLLSYQRPHQLIFDDYFSMSSFMRLIDSSTTILCHPHMYSKINHLRVPVEISLLLDRNECYIMPQIMGCMFLFDGNLQYSVSSNDSNIARIRLNQNFNMSISNIFSKYRFQNG